MKKMQEDSKKQEPSIVAVPTAEEQQVSQEVESSITRNMSRWMVAKAGAMKKQALSFQEQQKGSFRNQRRPDCCRRQEVRPDHWI